MTQGGSTAALWGAAILPRCVTHTFSPRDHFSHTPTLQIVEMTQLPCVTQDRADWTQKGCLVQSEFHLSTFRRVCADPAGKFLSLPGARDFRVTETQHSLNNMVWVTTAMLPVLMERAELKRGCRATPGSQPGTAKLPRTGQYLSAQCWSCLPGFYLGHRFSWVISWAQVLSSALWKFTKQTKCCRQRSRLKESALQLCQQTLREL